MGNCTKKKVWAVPGWAFSWLTIESRASTFQCRLPKLIDTSGGTALHCALSSTRYHDRIVRSGRWVKGRVVGPRCVVGYKDSGSTLIDNGLVVLPVTLWIDVGRKLAFPILVGRSPGERMEEDIKR